MRLLQPISGQSRHYIVIIVPGAATSETFREMCIHPDRSGQMMELAGYSVIEGSL
jgi:hypothetical protein